MIERNKRRGEKTFQERVRYNMKAKERKYSERIIQSNKSQMSLSGWHWNVSPPN